MGDTRSRPQWRWLRSFFFSSRRRHTRCGRDWSSDVCSSDLGDGAVVYVGNARVLRYRVRQYFQAARPADPWRDALIAEIADVDMVLTDSEMEALALENNRSEERRVGKEGRAGGETAGIKRIG